MRPNFDLAVDMLFLAASEPASKYDLDAFQAIRHGLIRLVAARYFDLNVDDANDVVSEATVKFIRAVRRNAVERSRAAAYLTTITLHEASDVVRRARAVPLDEERDTRAEDDDGQTAVEDRIGSDQSVSAVIEALIRKGEVSCAQIVAVWLDQAIHLGKTPSNRTVAEAAEVSHPTVSRCLRIFKELLKELDPPRN